MSRGTRVGNATEIDEFINCCFESRSYQTIGKDLTRVMNRLKALYRGWGIPCAGTQVYAVRTREEWLDKLPQAGVQRRAELLYQQLDGLQALRREVRPELLAESRKHK